MTIKELENMTVQEVVKLNIKDVIFLGIDALKAYARTIPNINEGSINSAQSIEDVLELIKNQSITNYRMQKKLELKEEKEKRESIRKINGLSFG